jgi:hypothetical protein
MVTDARGQIGQSIHLEDTASKGRSGRVIPMNEELRTALREYAETVWMPTSNFLIQSERSRGMSPQAMVNLFWRWYRHVGFDGCSSHSGRRTFITNTARKPENDKDWFLQSIPAPGRSRLTVELLAPTSDFEADSKLAVFDIVLNSG